MIVGYNLPVLLSFKKGARPNDRTGGKLNLKHVQHYFYTSNTKKYCNDPKFSDRYARTNSADPDQTAPRGSV